MSFAFSIVCINVSKTFTTTWTCLKIIRYLWKLVYRQENWRWLGSSLKWFLREGNIWSSTRKKREGLAQFFHTLGFWFILMLICKVCRKSWPLLVDLSSLMTFNHLWSKLFPRLLEAYWKWCLFCSPCAVPMYPVIISINNGCQSIYEFITLDWGMHSGKISWLTHFPDKIFMTWRFHLYKSWILHWFFFLSHFSNKPINFF